MSGLGPGRADLKMKRAGPTQKKSPPGRAGPTLKWSGPGRADLFFTGPRAGSGARLTNPASGAVVAVGNDTLRSWFHEVWQKLHFLAFFCQIPQ